MNTHDSLGSDFVLSLELLLTVIVAGNYYEAIRLLLSVHVVLWYTCCNLASFHARKMALPYLENCRKFQYWGMKHTYRW